MTVSAFVIWEEKPDMRGQIGQEIEAWSLSPEDLALLWPSFRTKGNRLSLPKQIYQKSERKKTTTTFQGQPSQSEQKRCFAPNMQELPINLFLHEEFN